MPTLHELGEARRILDQWYAEAEGEETPELGSLFAELSGSTDQKVENTVLYIFELQSNAAVLEAEETRLRARRKAIENRAARIRDRLEYEMQEQGIYRVKGLRATAGFQNGAPVLDIAPDSPLSDADQLAQYHNQGAPWVRLKPAEFSIDRLAMVRTLKQSPDAAPPGVTLRTPRYLVLR